MQTRLMKENIIFSFDKSSDFGRAIGKEVEGENSGEIVRQFLKRVMGMTGVEKIFIPVAHRIGKKMRTIPVQ